MAEEKKVDVLILGSGSAGLMASTFLSTCSLPASSTYAVLEKRSGPLLMGQADGVQCRTVEIYENFGLSEDVLREAFWILEVGFWSDETGEGASGPDGAGSNGPRVLKRTGRTIDTPPGLSWMPHVILNQARMHEFLISKTKKMGGRDVEYGWDAKKIEVDEEATGDHDAYCAKVTAVKDGREVVWRAKYVLACDGAHSSIRRSLGFTMIGDSTDAIWGVMDIYPITNFPDIRKKATIRTSSGNLLIIPREGGSLTRFYIELPEGTQAKSVKLSDLQQTAQEIFRPYTMEFADTAWWSAYSIGQRLASQFHYSHRVFLTGDACHTHSPKAGQGMNVSLQDGHNLGWKLASVLKGTSHPRILETYVSERQKVATELIDFDRYITKMWSSSKSKEEGISAQAFSKAFIETGRFTAGLTARYNDNFFVNVKDSSTHLAKNVTVGMRLNSAQVVRFCDAKAMQLNRALVADGRWRIVIFAGEIGESATLSRLSSLARYLDSEDGPVRKYTPKNWDIDGFIEPLLVFSGKRVDLEQEQIPEYFWPVTGKWGMRDIHKTFIDDESYNSGHGHAYDLYGIDSKKGAIVTVRPDTYVSMVIDIDSHEAIGEFFGGFGVVQDK